MSDWDAASHALDELLELPRERRAERLAGYPASLRQEVEELLDAHDRAGAFLSDAAPEQPHQLEPGDRLGPWRVEAPLGRGGMGAVYRVARDDGQFEMTAAAKVVAAGQITAEAAQRFRDERQILASLDHPNIARLVDGGVDANGRPYLVMELVSGVAITTYLRGRPVAARLDLFRSVCAAAHRAHQHLVVHRDIKPGNVLVTDEGVVKLVDFGIARPLEASSAVSSWQPLTPAYASPEQLRGDPVSTAADVWSLGALLYEILADRPPFDLRHASREEALALVQDTDPPPPCDDADLTAIVGRAMRKDSADRYASPAEMAADVSRWLLGYPVEAQPRSWRYIANKYVRRHRVGVALTAGALVVIAAAGAAAVWQGRAAQRQKVVAERRYREVRQLASAMIVGAHDRIAALPGSVAARRFLVEQGLTYLDRLSTETGDDDATARELAAGYVRLGDVLGRPSAFNLGDVSGALAAYAKAERLTGQLMAGRTGTPSIEDARQMSTIHGRVSDVYLDQHRPEALSRARAAVDALTSVAGVESDAVTLQALAYARFMLAAATSTIGGSRSTEEWDAALAIYERLLQGDPRSDNLRRNVALIHKNIASLYTSGAGQDPTKAQEHLAKALDADRARVAEAPTNPTARLDLSFDLSEAGTLLLNQHDFVAAAQHFRQVVDLRQALTDEDPRDVRARGRLAFAQTRLGRALSQLPQRAEARKHFEDALGNAAQVLAVSPDSVGTLGDRAVARAGLGVITSNCALVRQAVADVKALGARAQPWLPPLVEGYRRNSGC